MAKQNARLKDFFEGKRRKCYLRDFHVLRNEKERRQQRYKHDRGEAQKRYLPQQREQSPEAKETDVETERLEGLTAQVPRLFSIEE